MPGSREEDFWRNTSILHFLPKNYLPFGWGVMKFTISGLLPLMMLHTKFGKDWPSSFWGEDVNARRKTNDARRRTPTHSNRSPEWLRWPINFEKKNVMKLSKERKKERKKREIVMILTFSLIYYVYSVNKHAMRTHPIQPHVPLTPPPSRLCPLTYATNMQVSICYHFSLV